MIEYIWSIDLTQADVYAQGRYVATLAPFRRGGYVFARGRFMRFPSESAARAYIAEAVGR